MRVFMKCINSYEIFNLAFGVVMFFVAVYNQVDCLRQLNVSCKLYCHL